MCWAMTAQWPGIQQAVEKLWLGHRSVHNPKQFKSVLCRVAPQFRGYEQHDAQELLVFLLDGLHEDLNLCQKTLC